MFLFKIRFLQIKKIYIWLKEMMNPECFPLLCFLWIPVDLRSCRPQSDVCVVCVVRVCVCACVRVCVCVPEIMCSRIDLSEEVWVVRRPPTFPGWLGFVPERECVCVCVCVCVRERLCVTEAFRETDTSGASLLSLSLSPSVSLSRERWGNSHQFFWHVF